MVRVSPKEAIRIIESLARQIDTENCNAGRTEFWTEDGEYFSIAVTEKP